MRPRPAYLAMRAYQKSRILRARLGRGGWRWRGVRILGYHRLDGDRHSLSVRPDEFRRQMEALLEAGLEPVRVADALDLLERPVDGRYVCVTFDDGYHDNVEHAEPVLRELGIPATVYVATRAIDGDVAYDWYETMPRVLTWDEVRAALPRGVFDFQPHTRTHVRLPKVDEARAREEIAGSKSDLEEHVPYAATTFAYPAGLYGVREEALVREAGFRAGVSTDPGVNDAATPRERLRRTMIYWEDSFGDFRAKVAGLVDEPPRLRAWWYRRRSRP